MKDDKNYILTQVRLSNLSRRLQSLSNHGIAFANSDTLRVDLIVTLDTLGISYEAQEAEELNAIRVVLK